MTYTAPSGCASRSRRLLALCASTILCSGLASPALAQVAGAATPPPVRQSIDDNGVDVIRGKYYQRESDLVIGPNAKDGLSFQRISGVGGVNSLLAVIENVGGNIVVTLDGKSDGFTGSGSGYVSTEGNGATLLVAGASYTYTSSNGTIARFAGNAGYTYPFYEGELARLASVTYPDGSTLTSTLKVQTICAAGYENNVCQGPFAYIARLQSMRHSNGWQIKFRYALNTTKVDSDNYQDWGRITSVTGINNAVEYCDPSADSCSLTGNWPVAQYASTVNGSGDTVATVTDPLSRVTTYTSNLSSFKIKRPGAATDSTVVAYDGTQKVSSIVDEGVTHSYSYSDSGSTRTTTVTAPDGSTRVYVGDTTTFLLSSYRDELSRTTSYAFDTSGRLTQTTDPEGKRVQYTYDARGNVTEQRVISKTPGTPADIVTTATYASSCANSIVCNKPSNTTDAKGNATDYTYDVTHGGILSVTSPSPSVGAVRPQSRFSYSQLSAYVKPSAAGSPTASDYPTYKLSGISRCQTTASCAGGADEVKTTVDYGPQSAGTANNLLPVGTSSGSGDGALTATITVAYDNVGNRTYVDGPLAGTADTTRTIYDADREVVGIISADPDGAGALPNRAIRYSYNLDGQVQVAAVGTTSGQSDSAWNGFTESSHKYSHFDANARVDRQTLWANGDYGVADFLYDSRGRHNCSITYMDPAQWGPQATSCTPLQTNGPNGPDRVTKTLYDAAGQVTSVTQAVGTADQAVEAHYSYFDNGTPRWMADGNENYTSYVYDGFDRLVATIMPSPTSPGTGNPNDYEAYSHDANSNVTQRRLRDGQTISYTYDNLNRLTYKDVPNTAYYENDITYSFDLLGRLTQANNGVGRNVTLSYDALSRLTGEASFLEVKTMSYDLAGRMRQLSHPNTGLVVNYDRFVTGEVTAIRENGAMSGIGVLGSYTYDSLGRLTTLVRGNGVTTTFAFDPVSQLSSLSHDLAGTANDVATTFAYNPAGQIVSSTRNNDAYAHGAFANKDVTEAPNGLNQLVTQGAASLAYDGRGNLTSSGSATYTYTSENRLATTNRPTTLAYDAIGRLSQTNGPTATDYDHVGDHLIAEYNGSTGAMLRHYVFGPGGDDPLVWYEGSNSSDRRWPIADERGSVVAVTNASGAATAINSYEEYGVPGAGNIGRFQYTGQAWLPEVALYYYKARMYAPGLGRFMQTDPIGYDGGINLYSYVGGDPANARDPSGLANASSNPCVLNPRSCAAPEVTHAENDIVVTATKPNDGTKAFNDFLSSLRFQDILGSIANLTTPERQPAPGAGVEEQQNSQCDIGDFQPAAFTPQGDTKGDNPSKLTGGEIQTDLPGGLSDAEAVYVGLTRLAGDKNSVILPNPLTPYILQRSYPSGIQLRIGGDGRPRIDIPPQQGKPGAAMFPLRAREVIHFKGGKGNMCPTG